jgi:predicted transcriptional regulator
MKITIHPDGHITTHGDDLSRAVLEALWDGGPASNSAVQARLEAVGRIVATTTAHTTLRRLCADGIVVRDASTRTYAVRCSRAEYREEVLRRVADALRGGGGL